MRRVLEVFALGALAAIALGFLGARHEWFDGVGSFRLHFAALALLILAVALAFCHRKAAAIAGLGIAVAVATLGPVWQGTTPGKAGQAVRLVVVNINHLNPDPGAARAALIAMKPDVLVTIETIVEFVGDGHALRAAFPHRLVAEPQSGTHRVAIWSRYPLSHTRLDLNNTIAPTAASAVVTLPGGVRFGLIGVHLSKPVEGLQERQARALGPMAAELGVSTVIAGDFNAAPWSYVTGLAATVSGTQIAGGLRRSWHGPYRTPWGAMPAPLGHWIDHLLADPGIGVEKIEMLPVPGSDHSAQVATIRVPGG